MMISPMRRYASNWQVKTKMSTNNSSYKWERERERQARNILHHEMCSWTFGTCSSSSSCSWFPFALVHFSLYRYLLNSNLIFSYLVVTAVTIPVKNRLQELFLFWNTNSGYYFVVCTVAAQQITRSFAQWQVCIQLVFFFLKKIHNNKSAFTGANKCTATIRYGSVSFAWVLREQSLLHVRRC